MCQGYFTVSNVCHLVDETLSYLQDPTKYQTEEDRGIIRKLIEGYMIDKRTVILYNSLKFRM